MTLIEEVRAALATPHIRDGAIRAAGTVAEWLGVDNLTRLPGADTVTRCAHSIYHGMTAEEAAAREYLHRWHLPLNLWIDHTEARGRSRPVTGAWPVPHLIGM